MRSSEQLMAALYWADDEEPLIKIIDVFICKLRKKLRPLDIKIETIWGRGYRLQIAATPPKEAK
ncbi:helix-turn-helix domain-containing protein [Phyllobacteriaceae bacterium JZ32]